MIKNVKLIEKIILGFCFCIIAYLLFFQLGKAPFDNWDEAWYAEATKHMLQTKDFIVLNWNHAVWLDKPPMYIWLATLVSSVFGLSEFSVRFTSALSGLIVVVIVLLYSYKKFGIVPALLAFSTLALNNLFIWRTRSGNIDAFVTLLILLTYFLQISKHKYKYPLLGLLFACIYLTKASLVLFPLSIFFLHEIFYERKNIIKKYKEYLLLIFIMLLLPAIWLSLGYLKVGGEFVQYYLFKSDQGVAEIDFMKLNPDYMGYMYYSLQRRFFFVFVIGALFALRYIKDSKYFLMLLYSLALLFQLSFTMKSNNWYLMPSIPFWSMLVAFGTYNVIKLCKNNIFVIAAIVLLSSYVSYRTLTTNILPILDMTAVIKQAQSSKALHNLTKEGDIVVRLDHLYPTTIYYTDRKVLSSPDRNGLTETRWISRPELIEKIKRGEIKWVVGINSDVLNFQKEATGINFRLRKVNDEETIGEVL